MKINYILSFPISLVYHIFAQIDFSKEWGPASIFNHNYLKNIDNNLILEEDKKKKFKNNINDFFGLVCFVVLCPYYINFNQLKNDFSDKNFIKEKIKNYPNLDFKKARKGFRSLIEIAEENKKSYLDLWNKNIDEFKNKLLMLKNYHQKILNNYLIFLNNQINPSIKLKDHYFIFVIPSLFIMAGEQKIRAQLVYQKINKH